MQFASAKREVLIFAPSLNLIPVFSVALPLSEPAKSINESLPVRTYCSVPAVHFLELTTICRIAWDLLDV
jgi:hypothetical protein